MRLRVEELDAWAEEHRWLTLDVEHVWKFTLADAPLEELPPSCTAGEAPQTRCHLADSLQS